MSGDSGLGVEEEMTPEAVEDTLSKWLVPFATVCSIQMKVTRTKNKRLEAAMTIQMGKYVRRMSRYILVANEFANVPHNCQMF